MVWHAVALLKLKEVLYGTFVSAAMYTGIPAPPIIDLKARLKKDLKILKD